MSTTIGKMAVFSGVFAVCVLGFLATIYAFGIVWVSENITSFVLTAAFADFWICLFIFLPASRYRATQIMALYGFYGSAIIFGVCVWILGYLTIYQYWGGLGVLVGLVLGVVGIVPIGIFISLFYADWIPFGLQMLGLAFVYSTYSFAVRVAAKMKRAKNRTALTNSVEGDVVSQS